MRSPNPERVPILPTRRRASKQCMLIVGWRPSGSPTVSIHKACRRPTTFKDSYFAGQSYFYSFLRQGNSPIIAKLLLMECSRPLQGILALSWRLTHCAKFLTAKNTRDPLPPIQLHSFALFCMIHAALSEAESRSIQFITSFWRSTPESWVFSLSTKCFNEVL